MKCKNCGARNDFDVTSGKMVNDPGGDPSLASRELRFKCRACGNVDTRTEYPYLFAAAAGIPVNTR